MAYEHVWNTSFEASPATSDQASEGALRIRNLKEAIRERMQEGHYWDPAGTDADHGKHVAPTFKDSVTDPAAPAVTNEIKLYNKAGELYLRRQADVKHVVLDPLPVPIPAGTKMLFKQNAAPAGWTFVAEDNDRVLLNTNVVSEGGTLGGNWVISGVAAGDHVLTEAELPSITIQTWGINYADIETMVGWTAAEAKSNLANTMLGNTWTSTFGAGNQAFRTPNTLGQAHSHPLAADGAWRPAYAKVITCTKD